MNIRQERLIIKTLIPCIIQQVLIIELVQAGLIGSTKFN